MPRRSPPQKPGRSKQDYQTPPEFLAAVKAKLGITAFTIDLAATADNTAADRFYSPADDSLKQSWAPTGPGWAWLNPPFAHLAPWVKKAYYASHPALNEPISRASIAMLVPAGVGSNWWKQYVHYKAHVLLLNGRITFVGEAQGYPKDCCLLLFNPSNVPTYEVWTWPEQLLTVAA